MTSKTKLLFKKMLLGGTLLVLGYMTAILISKFIFPR